MKVTRRESNMVLLAIAVVLGASTYLFGEARWKEWKELSAAQETLEKEIELDQRLLEQRETWSSELAQLMGLLRSFAPGQQVAPQLMEQVNELARSNQLTLPSQSPEAERDLGQVYEVAVRCQFEGGLEALVRFLFSLQTAGSHFNVRNISVAPTGKGDELRGNVTVDCAYTRAAPPTGAAPVQPEGNQP